MGSAHRDKLTAHDGSYKARSSGQRSYEEKRSDQRIVDGEDGRILPNLECLVNIVEYITNNVMGSPPVLLDNPSPEAKNVLIYPAQSVR
jgi:hypothetical protein